MTDTKLYADRAPWKLEPHYSAHVAAMTSEGLHSKADIAAELAFRDKALEEVREAAEAEHDDQECCIVEQQKEIAALRVANARQTEELTEARLLIARAMGTVVGLRAHVPRDHRAKEAADECADALSAFLDGAALSTPKDPTRKDER
jgi:hypothetical protein